MILSLLGWQRYSAESGKGKVFRDLAAGKTALGPDAFDNVWPLSFRGRHSLAEQKPSRLMTTVRFYSPTHLTSGMQHAKQSTSSTTTLYVVTVRGDRCCHDFGHGSRGSSTGRQWSAARFFRWRIARCVGGRFVFLLMKSLRAPSSRLFRAARP